MDDISHQNKSKAKNNVSSQKFQTLDQQQLDMTQKQFKEQDDKPPSSEHNKKHSNGGMLNMNEIKLHLQVESTVQDSKAIDST